jgi:hypothetical protein
VSCALPEAAESSDCLAGPDMQRKSVGMGKPAFFGRKSDGYPRRGRTFWHTTTSNLSTNAQPWKLCRVSRKSNQIYPRGAAAGMKKSTPLIAKWRRIISQLRCFGLPAVVQDQGIPYHHHQGRMSRLLGVIAVRTVEPRMGTV